MQRLWNRSTLRRLATAMAVVLALPAASALAADLPQVEIPYTSFQLSNGLTVLVHEDHKAPIVAVNIWYHVGSKNEPFGRSGFAHLFEHLMFNGSENYNDDYFKVVERLGATDLNGTTNEDRTNYFQNVPVAAIDTVLWLESDRMGHLLGAIDQPRLDEQRGVVQNEKRQGENEPYAISEDLITRAVWPKGHPYDHTVIGSMEDLSAAKLEDVKDWFGKYYGPSNAVLTLAGDIDPATAKAKVEKFFGDLPPGPPVPHPKTWVARRSGVVRETAEDRVPQSRLYQVWNVPPIGDPDWMYLTMLGNVLAGDKGSRLYKRLVYQDQIATNVNAFLDDREIASLFEIVLTAQPGGDLAKVEATAAEELNKLIANGPTADEVERVRNSLYSRFVRGAERIGGFGGKSDVLLRGAVFQNDPAAYKTYLDRLRKATPRQLTSLPGFMVGPAKKLEKTMMTIILLLIVAVAAFNVVASLVMVVAEKRNDIAILRTLGLSRGGVVATFIVQGTVIGWAGALAGIGLGIVLALNAGGIVHGLEVAFGFELFDPAVYYISRIPSELRRADVALVSVTAFALTLVATIYPARRAAATEPAEALRYE